MCNEKNNCCHCHTTALVIGHIIVISAIAGAFMCLCKGKMKRAARKIKDGAEECIDTCRDTYEDIRDDMKD